MTIKNGNIPAMPLNQYKRSGDLEVSEPVSSGMTKREIMAMHIASGFISKPQVRACDVAATSVKVADALLAELDRTK